MVPKTRCYTRWLSGKFEFGKYLYKKATVKIKEALSSNEMYMENAQSSAVTLISNLVKNLNPNILDLNVEVEFME